jgi:hypothetical protein
VSDSLMAFTGDRASAEVLRRTLRAVADEYADQPLGTIVREVLAGRREVRDLATDPDFAELADRGMRAHQEAWDALTPEERAHQTRLGEAYLADLDDELTS